MAMIHVNRSGTSLGVFSEADVRTGLRAGRFVGTDLGWREGMAQWQPLSQFAEFAGDLPSAAAPPAAAPSAAAPSAAATPSIPMVPSATAAFVPQSGLPWDSRQSRGFLPAFF